jgi:FSR family fosmidomycin resistance protein-like MFS transporter
MKPHETRPKRPPFGGLLLVIAMDHTGNTDIKVIIGLTLVHFIGDFYSSFINPLLPVFVQKYALTLTEVGLLAGLSRFLAFIVQPTVGYLADYYRTRFFILGGPFLAIVFIALVGVAPSYPILLVFISLGSIGSSMFHPSTAGMISTYAGRHFGLSMSVFNTGGTFAFGLGPIFITYLVGIYGLEASPVTMVFGLAIMMVLLKIVPPPHGEGLARLGFFGSLKEVLGSVWKPIVLIWVVMVLRAFVGHSFRTFLPVLYAQEGYALVAVGAIISLFTVAGAVSGLLAGHLSDRVGYKPIFYLAHGLTTPSLFLLLYLKGNWVFCAAFLAGFFAMATLPLGVAMAQELAPKGKSIVSSLMMGLAFGLGGILMPLTGKLAEIFSIRGVLLSLTILPCLTIFLIALLPEINSRSGRSIHK